MTAKLQLDSNIPPNSPLDHHKMTPNGKEIWDRSYAKEYMGLHESQQAWKYISQHGYDNLKKYTRTALPSMSIAVIKRDEHGKPFKVKYRIVVLGNMDPNYWDKSDCYAPVMSHLEPRILLSLAVQSSTAIYSGELSQAFCQSFLPEGENYVIKPPRGCPITPPKTYLLLRKTLFGLKRSPRHWLTKHHQPLNL